MSRRRYIALSISVLCTLFARCGGGEDGAIAAPESAITMSLNSSGATVTQGESTTFSVTVTGSNGFIGPATIAVSGVPNGVTAAASAPQVAGSATTSTVTISVGTAASAGTYTLSVTGSGSGVASVTRSFALTVAALPGGFTIAASVPTVTIAQGSSSTITITIARSGGFAGSVAFAAAGMSNGLTATFTPASATGSSATLTLTANSIAATGTVALTIVGSAASLPLQTITTQVTVMPGPSGGAGSVTVDFSGCPAEVKPVWFAYQDGNSAWARVTTTNDVYRFTISANAGGYVFAERPSANASRVVVKFLSRAELTDAPINVCPVPRGNKSVVATFALDANQSATVNLGGSSVQAPATQVAATATVTVPNVPNGTFDLVAWRMNGTRGLNTAGDSKGIILRDVNASDGASLGSLNFNAADFPIAWSMNFAGAIQGDTYTGSMSYYTGPRESCAAALLYNFSTTLPSLPAGGAWGFPEAVQKPTDFYVLNAVASNGASTRIVQKSYHGIRDVSSLPFGGSVATPIVSDVSGSAFKRLQVTGSTPAEYSSTVDFLFTNAAGDKSAAIHASTDWLGGNAATLTFPDFAGVNGWDSSWMPASGSTVLWRFGGTGATYTGLPCVQDALFRSGHVSGEK